MEHESVPYICVCDDYKIVNIETILTGLRFYELKKDLEIF